MEPSAATILAALLLASQLSGLSIDPARPLPRVGLGDQVKGKPIGNHAAFVAVTSGDGSTVNLSREWTGSPSDICVLTHEMTHVLQAQHSWPGGCQTREPLAYRVSQLCASLSGDTGAAAYYAGQVSRPSCFE